MEAMYFSGDFTESYKSMPCRPGVAMIHPESVWLRGLLVLILLCLSTNLVVTSYELSKRSKNSNSFIGPDRSAGVIVVWSVRLIAL